MMARAEGTSLLPADILHLLCTELANQLDFSTLYRCAVSGKDFANAGALSNLYRHVSLSRSCYTSNSVRVCNDSPVRSGGNEAISFPEQELVVQRWSILWRTIILSAFGKTLYPYCRYLRVLDLRDLTDLLDDDKLRGKIAK